MILGTHTCLTALKKFLVIAFFAGAQGLLVALCPGIILFGSVGGSGKGLM